MRKGSPGPGRLQDRVALVAGVGEGVGSAIAALFAAEGARIALAARRRHVLDATARSIRRRGGEAVVATADLATEEGAAGAVRAALDGYGRLDIVVVAVGGYRASRLHHTDAELFEGMWRANVATHFAVIRAAVPALEKSGGGSIVTIAASSGGSFPGRKLLAYNTAKAAARSLAENAAADLLSHGIRVNCILPGGVSHVYRPGRAWNKARKLRGVGLPEDVAHAALFLASDEAPWITGAVLTVDGGMRVNRTVVG